MMIFLLEECNFSCSHCVREDEPMGPDYRLSFGQLQLCLSDCRSLDSVRWVHFSGGEPTLWTDGNHDLVDLLLEISDAGFTPGFTTNGSHFANYDLCHDFFEKYLDGSAMPLRLYVSIDTFHNNFDAEKGRSQSLDNVIRCKTDMSPGKGELLNIAVAAVISKDARSLLPDEMIRHYESLGVTFSFVPLRCKGKGKKLSHLCPDLGSDKPEDLGAYYRFCQTGAQSKRNQENLDEALCTVLIGDDYYVSWPWRKVAELGRLPDTIIHMYSDND